jgi:hypothetical protein
MTVHADTPEIVTDYLVIGAGASGMAFIDTLLTETDADIVVVDQRHRPGGHWNDAYPFVRLHQTAAYYGVASKELTTWAIDQVGLNAGMYELSSGPTIVSYYDEVMRQRFLPSRRVRWFPMCTHSEAADGSHCIRSLTSGSEQRVTVRKKVVYANLGSPEIPSTHPPKYEIGTGVTLIPVNDLPKVKRPYSNHTVVGSGKTGIDACLWLMENGVAPSHIRWIMPRDAWLQNRANHQPGPENFDRSIGQTVWQFEAIMAAGSIEELFSLLEKRGLLMRIDPSVTPTTYRCAIVSERELAELRRIDDIVRLGRVQSIERTEIVLDKGRASAEPDTLYIDCTAPGLVSPKSTPIFEHNRINLQMVRWCQPAFSAATVAFVESLDIPVLEKAALCTPVPAPEVPRDWLVIWLETIKNMSRWAQNERLGAWLKQCRLNTTTVYTRGVDLADPSKLALVEQLRDKAKLAAVKLPQLLASAADIAEPATA